MFCKRHIPSDERDFKETFFRDPLELHSGFVYDNYVRKAAMVGDYHICLLMIDIFQAADRYMPIWIKASDGIGPPVALRMRNRTFFVERIEDNSEEEHCQEE